MHEYFKIKETDNILQVSLTEEEIFNLFESIPAVELVNELASDTDIGSSLTAVKQQAIFESKKTNICH